MSPVDSFRRRSDQPAYNGDFGGEQYDKRQLHDADPGGPEGNALIIVGVFDDGTDGQHQGEDNPVDENEGNATQGWRSQPLEPSSLYYEDLRI